MTGKPELLGDVEVLVNAARALGNGKTQDLPPTQDIKDAVQRITDEAKKQNTTCQETKDIIRINDCVQKRHLGREDLEDAVRIGGRAGAGTIGIPPVPHRKM